MAEQHYSGGCHCGAVRFEVDADLDQAVKCNCSICSKHGLILAFTPSEKFSLTSGDDATREYLFNKHVIRHRFCTTCGVEPFASGETPGGGKMTAINLRCLDDVDLTAIHPERIDGRSL